MPHKAIKKLTAKEKGFVLEALNLLLLELQLDNNYEIGILNGSISIICIKKPESTMFAEFNKRLLGLSTGLQRNITATEGEGTVIVQIDLKKLESLYNDFGKKLDASDKILFHQLPEQIRLRWHRFSPALRAHILKCKKDGFDRIDLVSTALFNRSIRSAIGLGVPLIPVYLPGTNDVYDLTELLDIEQPEQRNPQNIYQRRDPLTRGFFNLYQIAPATQATRKLKKALDSNEVKEACDIALIKNVLLNYCKKPDENLKQDYSENNIPPEFKAAVAFKKVVLDDISNHLKRLQGDVRSCVVFQADRKKEKIAGLEHLRSLIIENPQLRFAENLKTAEKGYTQLRVGYFSKIAQSFEALLQQEKDLIDNSEVYSFKPKQ